MFKVANKVVLVWADGRVSDEAHVKLQLNNLLTSLNRLSQGAPLGLIISGEVELFEAIRSLWIKPGHAEVGGEIDVPVILDGAPSRSECQSMAGNASKTNFKRVGTVSILANANHLAVPTVLVDPKEKIKAVLNGFEKWALRVYRIGSGASEDPSAAPNQVEVSSAGGAIAVLARNRAIEEMIKDPERAGLLGVKGTNSFTKIADNAERSGSRPPDVGANLVFSSVADLNASSGDAIQVRDKVVVVQDTLSGVTPEAFDLLQNTLPNRLQVCSHRRT